MNDRPAAHYRPEIDGLRAVAVFSVIMFHAGSKALPGGFIGVDIFFVISGYLISLILAKELETGSFSIARFYVRRARRILPALVLVVLCCLPFAWTLMLPDEFKRFGQSVLSVGAFCSNIFFWLKTDYFSRGAVEQPLLHTWSLSVEEQYYFLFPIFLALTWRFTRKARTRLVIATALVSLVGSEWGWRHYSAGNFYLLPSRGWELLAGVLAAFWQLSGRGDAVDAGRHRLAAAATWLGLGAIIYAILGFNHDTPSPSLWTLIPVMGTVLIITLGDRNRGAGRLLSWRPFVALGLISYSAYLWHQPIIAFARLSGLGYGRVAWPLQIVAVTLPLSYLSWRFVEQPFRKPSSSTSDRMVFGMSAFALGTCWLFGACIVYKKGFPERPLMVKSSTIDQYLAVKAQMQGWQHWCESHPADSSFRLPICGIGNREVEPEIMLWGDSFAGALLPGLDYELKRVGLSALVFEADGCPPLPGVSRVGYAPCTANIHSDFVKYLSTLPHIKTVVWYGNLEGAMVNQDIRINGAETSPTIVSGIMRATIASLGEHGKKVIFLEQGPYMWTDAPDFYVRAELRHDTTELEVSKQHYREFMNPVQSVRGMIEASADFIDTEDIFCLRDRCPARRSEYGLMYSDDGHVSLAVAKVLARLILAKANPNNQTAMPVARH